MWAGTTSMTAKNHEGLAWGRAKKTGGMPLNNLNFPLSRLAAWLDFLPCGLWVDYGCLFSGWHFSSLFCRLSRLLTW